MWLLLTLATSNIHFERGRISFTVGKTPWAIPVKQLGDFLLGCFYHFSSYIQVVSIWGYLCLNKIHEWKNSQTYITWCKYEWNRAWWVRFPSSVFQPGLINSNKFREVISDDAPSSWILQPSCLLFHTAWGSVFDVHHPKRSWSQIL